MFWPWEQCFIHFNLLRFALILGWFVLSFRSEIPLWANVRYTKSMLNPSRACC